MGNNPFCLHIILGLIFIGIVLVLLFFRFRFQRHFVTSIYETNLISVVVIIVVVFKIDSIQTTI